MNIIDFLVNVLKVLGLVSLILILFDIIIDALIIAPIMKRAEKRKQLELFDLLIEKAANGEVEMGIMKTDDEKDDEEKIEE